LAESKWGDYSWAYKAIHDKLNEIFQKLEWLKVFYLPPTSVWNIGQVVNGDFEVVDVLNPDDIHGWLIGELGAQWSNVNYFSGLKSCTIKKTQTALGGLHQAFSPSIPTKDIEDFSIMVYSHDRTTDGTLKVRLKYSDGTESIQDVNVPYNRVWTKRDLTYHVFEDKFITSIRIWTEDTLFTNFNILYIDMLTLKYKQNVKAEVSSVEMGSVFSENIGQLVNGSFERGTGVQGLNYKYKAIGWLPYADNWGSSLYCTVSEKYDGQRCLCVTLPLRGVYQVFNPPINSNEIIDFAIMVKGSKNIGEFYPVAQAKIYYSDGNSKVTTLQAFWLAWWKNDILFDKDKWITCIEIVSMGGAEEFPLYFDMVVMTRIPFFKAKIPESLVAGEQTVAQAGTAVALGSGALEHGVYVQAMSDNTGAITVGNSSGQYFELSAGQSTPLLVVDNLGDIYVDASVNGEGVNYVGS